MAPVNISIPSFGKLGLMSRHTVIEDPMSLQSNYLPSEFIDREEEEAALQSIFSEIDQKGPRHTFIYGPRGTGKTHLVLKQLNQLPDSVATCYIPCHRHDTEYKALKQLYETVTDDQISSGHHTAALKREIGKRTTEIGVVIVLDELDFLMLNDGDDLLYYLSRTNEFNTVLISANHDNINDCIEERTQSSLQPRQITFDPYTSEELYQILYDRVQDAFAPQSLQQEALTYLASAIENPALGFDWLRAAAEAADSVITESNVKETRMKGLRHYIDAVLNGFSEHHRLLFQAIKELSREHDSSIHTGQIYDQYQELCQAYEEDPLSNRRISDLLKYLELLDLIEADYHYGGKKGKTREIQVPKL